MNLEGESLQLFISIVGTVMPSDSGSKKIFGSKRDNISLSVIFGSVSLSVASLRRTAGGAFISAGVIAVSTSCIKAGGSLGMATLKQTYRCNCQNMRRNKFRFLYESIDVVAREMHIVFLEVIWYMVNKHTHTHTKLTWQTERV